MADFIPNEGEAEILNIVLGKIAQPTLYLGLMNNSVASVQGFGEAMVWANVVPATGFVGGDEVAFSPANWTVPSGASAGQPATHAQVEFTADAGGADNVSGYYIRTSNNRLLVVGLNPEVEISGVLKSMLEGARYRVNPQLGAS